MPELPEVTALVTDLRARLIGRTVQRLELVSFAALKTFDPPASALGGRVVMAVERRGKYLDIVTGEGLDQLHLIIHLARAGWLRWRKDPPSAPTRPGRGPLAARLFLSPEDGRADSLGSGFDLTEAGTKKSLALWIVRSPSEVPGVARLGPDPLGANFTVDSLAAILANQGRAQIKGVLRSQSVIAGIGNAYSDEILHVARMSPYKPASMPRADVEVLFAAMRETLLAAIARADGLAASELKAEKKSNLRVHGRAGEACPVCGDVVRQVKFSESTFEYCATCQTGGKPLADRVLSRLLK